MDELIFKQTAIEALNGIINRFEQILRDIRESKVDDSVCGMCEYDGAYIGQSGDWCNECPGFEEDDCFKLSDECRKRWLKSVDLPSEQSERKKVTWVEKEVIHADEAKKAIEEWQSCKCSACGRYDTRPYMYYFSEPKFCSYCGAEMKRSEE